MNETILIGRLTRDIELKEYGKGKSAGSYARFALAVRDGVDQDGNELVQFINCVAWNNQAQILAKYVHKGDGVAVQGRLTQNDYEDDNGKMVYSYQVTVSRVELLPTRKSAEEPEAQDDPKAKTTSRKYHK